MKIVLLVEGGTERAFVVYLRQFLAARLEGKMPKLGTHAYDGRLPKGEKLKRTVESLLKESDAVIALTDVYTGTNDFADAADAKAQMRNWVGANDRFYPHAACHDFEAWLLPYWADLQNLAGHNVGRPAGDPEKVNHLKPPSKRIAEMFRNGRAGRDYSKIRDAKRVLELRGLDPAIRECSELRALVNTILKLNGAETL